MYRISVIFILFAVGIGISNISGATTTEINWEQIADVTGDLIDGVTANVGLLPVVGGIAGDGAGNRIKTSIRYPMEAINNLANQFNDEIVIRNITLTRAREYEVQIRTQLKQIQSNVDGQLSDLGLSGPIGIRICDILKETFEHLRRSSMDLNALLHA